MLPWFEVRQRPPICCPTKLAPDKILLAHRQLLPSLSRRLRDDTQCTSSSHAHPTKYDANFGDIQPTTNVFSSHLSYKSIGHTAGEVRHQVIRSNTALRLSCWLSCYQTWSYYCFRKCFCYCFCNSFFYCFYCFYYCFCYCNDLPWQAWRTNINVSSVSRQSLLGAPLSLSFRPSHRFLLWTASLPKVAALT